MWSTSKDKKQAMSEKVELLKNFSKIREAPCVSGPQLKIKNEIMRYCWTFGKIRENYVSDAQLNMI